MKKLEQRVPNLRFKGFTNDWEQHKLGDIAKVTKLAGFEFTKYINYSSKGKILAIRGLNIKDGKFNLQDVKYIDNSDFNKLTRSKLRQDDILFTYVGTIGNSAIVPAGVKWYLAPNVCLIRTQTENAKFISHLIQSDKFQHQEIPKWITTSSQPALSMENIRKFSIILPTISEQLKISNLVSIIDTIITLQQRKLDLLKQLKKGLLQKMFADKDSKQPILRFKGFHDDWEQHKLGDVVNLIGGGPFKSTDSVSKGIPWLKIANVGVNGITWNTESYLPEYFWNDYPQYQLKKGNYVVALTRPILNHRLKISKLDRDALLNQRVAKLTTSENLQYIVHLLERKKVVLQIENNLSGSDPPNLSSKDLYRIKIKIPSESNEQKQIGTFLTKLDSIISLQHQKLAKYQSIKKSLLQQMFI